MKPIPPILLVTAMIHAADYQALKTTVDSIEVVRLVDAKSRTEVWVVPSLGNNAYDMTVNGKKVFWSPYQTLGELKARPAMAGNPFLAPWANRIDQDAFYAGGKKYLLNPELKNFRYDGNRKPIHGLLVYAPDWKVVAMEADARSARVTSRLEFWRNPGWMAQFPFAHTYEMTYRLSEGVLEVETVIENLSREPMPVSLGYHTYYQLHDAPRDDWKVRLSARQQVVLSSILIPTGEQRPNPYPDPVSLAGQQLDDVFSELVRDPQGRAEFSVSGQKEKITVLYGPKYTVSVVYAPKGRNFICFEPMTGPTNAFNLAQEGKYKDLQTVAPGAKWRESFWIRPSGF